MSTEILPAAGVRWESAENKPLNRFNTEAAGQVQKVWCAPMNDAGEWVITWTRVAGALAYEVQTSMDASQWSDGSKFSGTRAVVLLGPSPCCWVRVRAVGFADTGLWSQPVMGEKT